MGFRSEPYDEHVKTLMLLAFLTLSISGCTSAAVGPETAPTGVASAPTPTTADVVSKTTLSGTISTPRHPESPLSTKNCLSDAGFDDVHEGAQITLRNPSDEIIALAELESGTMTSTGCSFKFDVKAVPPGHGFYTVDVGNSFRGTYTVAEEDLGVFLTLSLG